MNFVIPMAGRGQRFIDAGYELPKMLIQARGKTLLQWSVDSLPMSLCSKLIFIILKEHEIHFNLSKIIHETYKHIKDIKIFILDEVTNGQAETVYLARHLFDNNKPILIFNIDTYFVSKSLESDLKNTSSDGIIGAFKSNQKRFSYAKIDSNGIVTQTAEKEVISEYALTGMYHFTNTKDFIDSADTQFTNDFRINNEYYIAPLYNFLIEKGRKFVLNNTDTIHILGTPEELDNFISYDSV